MYSQEDLAQVEAQLRKRRILTFLPPALLFAVGAAVFAVCQGHRQDWGWGFAAAATILGGWYGLFLYGVYLRPMKWYLRHVRYMLEGRKRETTGILTSIAESACDKEGLDWYALTVNVGEKNDPEEERLLYYDALKGRPELPLGARVTVLSNDKMIADIRRV